MFVFACVFGNASLQSHNFSLACSSYPHVRATLSVNLHERASCAPFRSTTLSQQSAMSSACADSPPPCAAPQLPCTPSICSAFCGNSALSWVLFLCRICKQKPEIHTHVRVQTTLTGLLSSILAPHAIDSFDNSRLLQAFHTRSLFLALSHSLHSLF